MSTLRKIRKNLEPERPTPIVFVPDPSYIDDTGHLKPTSVTIIADNNIYRKIDEVLKKPQTRELDVPGRIIVVSKIGDVT
jgi:hypothetical protein